MQRLGFSPGVRDRPSYSSLEKIRLRPHGRSQLALETQISFLITVIWRYSTLSWHSQFFMWWRNMWHAFEAKENTSRFPSVESDWSLVLTPELRHRQCRQGRHLATRTWMGTCRRQGGHCPRDLHFTVISWKMRQKGQYTAVHKIPPRLVQELFRSCFLYCFLSNGFCRQNCYVLRMGRQTLVKSLFLFFGDFSCLFKTRWGGVFSFFFIILLILKLLKILKIHAVVRAIWNAVKMEDKPIKQDTFFFQLVSSVITGEGEDENTVWVSLYTCGGRVRKNSGRIPYLKVPES